MTSARRRARAYILRKKPRAKKTQDRCARRSRTTVACRVRFKLGSKVAVRSKKSTASSW